MDLTRSREPLKADRVIQLEQKRCLRGEGTETWRVIGAGMKLPALNMKARR